MPANPDNELDGTHRVREEDALAIKPLVWFFRSTVSAGEIRFGPNGCLITVKQLKCPIRRGSWMIREGIIQQFSHRFSAVFGLFSGLGIVREFCRVNIQSC
jgi:hypothetical protein